MTVNLNAVVSSVRVLSALSMICVNIWSQPPNALPPITTPVLIGDISATVITSFVPVPGAPGAPEKVHATADLGELQTKLGPIFRERLEASPVCGRKVSISSARLIPSTPSGTLDLSIHTEEVACANVPRPATPVRSAGRDTQIRMRLVPSAARLHLNLDAQIVSVAPDDGAAADMPPRLRTLVPEVLFGHIQPDAPGNGIPAALSISASIDNLRFVDLGGNRLGLAAEVTLPLAAMTAARMLRQGKSNGPALPPDVTERNLQVGVGRWPVDGTLTLPSGEGPCPGVLLMRGETVLDRDGSLQFDKPLRDYAWGLAARGIAVLRYDLRRWAYAASMAKANEPVDVEQDILADAVSALRILRTAPRIRGDRVFILGVGDAGVLTPRAALRAPPVPGLILISASGRMRWEIMSLIARRILDDTNAPPAQRQAATQMAELATLLKSTPIDKWPSPAGNMPQSYWRFWQTYDPGAQAARFPGSLLLVFGSKDEPLFAPEWAKWQAALGSRPRVTQKVFPEFTPLLQPVSPAPPASAFTPQKPVSPVALDFIAQWIAEQ